MNTPYDGASQNQKEIGSENTEIKTLEPYKIINSAERVRIEQFFMEQSGLKEGQFAMNSFGFPPIPIPSPRKMSGKLRLAPTNVKNEFLGHPIYWIDPELTRFDPQKESADNWSIRMFFLITAFGLFNENNEWVDFLEERGFDYSEVEVYYYHQPDNPNCFADLPEFAFLKQNELTIELEFIDATAQNALIRCAGMLAVENEKSKKNQQIAYGQALSIIGNNNLTDTTVEYYSDGGYWKRSIEPMLNKVITEYEKRIESMTVFEVTNIMFDASTKIKNILIDIDRYTTLLAIPQVSESENLKERYTAQMAYLALSSAYNKAQESDYNFVPDIDYALSQEVSSDGINHWLSRIASMYELAWKRLRLATVNYERQSQGKDVYSNYDEFEVSSASNNTLSLNRQENDIF